MTTRIKNWLVKADNFLERNRRYLRPVGFLLFLIVAGLAVEYLFVAIASVYALATLLGAQTFQLVIGAISATSAFASALVAFLLYRISIRGAEITVAIDDLLEAEVEYRIRRTLAPASQVPTGATQELFEKLSFEFEIVLMNVGPRGGTMTDVDLKLLKPAGIIPTINGEDKISVFWEMKVVTRETYRPTIFRSGMKNSLSIASNEGMVLAAGVDMLLTDEQKAIRPPSKTWLEIQNQTPYFEFTFQWRTATKGSRKSHEKQFTVRPRFGTPIVEPPGVTVP